MNLRGQARAFASRAKVAAEHEIATRARRAPIEDRTVLYESFAGNGMLCNPEAIFRELLAADDQRDLRHVWALTDPARFAGTVAEFVGDPRVTFVERRSRSYYAALATAKYLVNNATFPPSFAKRDGQVYLNTWHGTPVKAMGYDVPGGAVDARNIVRNFVSADYLLAPNDATSRMYLDAYRMRNIYRGAILTGGTPRIDRQFVPEQGREATRSRLRKDGVVIGDGRQIMLYAPTWKGSFYEPTNDIRQLQERVAAMSAQLDGKYRLLLKVHQQVYRYASADPALRELLVPNEIPTNDVLAVTDVLITDYSSIFVDFLTSGRPVLFYTPDLSDYAASRGLYLPPERWPGPVCRTIEQLVGELERLGGAGDPVLTCADAYAATRESYCAGEDGRACARLVDAVFRGYETHVERGFSDGRTPILIYLGGMLANGVTSSALNLLDNIDHDRFDVSVTFPYRTAQLGLIGLVNSRARLLPRLGGSTWTRVQVAPPLVLRRPTPLHSKRESALLRDEWVRSFGASRFEHVVDFSGYSEFWTKLMTSGGRGTFALWQHNDMRAEISNRDRSRLLRANVSGVMALYKHADRLVSVSRALCEVNKERLAQLAPADRFTYARNTINFERIHHLAYGAPATLRPELEAGGERPSYHGRGVVTDEAERRETLTEVLPPAPGIRTFVTAGRLTTQKNHLRLVRAFRLVHRADPNTRLVILGSGPLRGQLSAEIEELGLSAAVMLAGHRPNPYVVLAHADCFVLSSDYEGQPMVLLEALILGLPVVTTSFDSVRGALPDGYGMIVERNVDALAGGMSAFLRGEVPTLPFDYVAYNRDATQEFYRAIGG